MMKSSQNIISGVFETLWNNVMIIMLPFYIVPYLPVYKFGRMNLHLFVAGIEGIFKQIDHICCFFFRSAILLLNLTKRSFLSLASILLSFTFIILINHPEAFSGFLKIFFLALFIFIEHCQPISPKRSHCHGHLK